MRAFDCPSSAARSRNSSPPQRPAGSSDPDSGYRRQVEGLRRRALVSRHGRDVRGVRRRAPSTRRIHPALPRGPAVTDGSGRTVRPACATGRRRGNRTYRGSEGGSGALDRNGRDADSCPSHRTPGDGSMVGGHLVSSAFLQRHLQARADAQHFAGRRHLAGWRSGCAWLGPASSLRAMVETGIQPLVPTSWLSGPERPRIRRRRRRGLARRGANTGHSRHGVEPTARRAVEDGGGRGTTPRRRVVPVVQRASPSPGGRAARLLAAFRRSRSRCRRGRTGGCCRALGAVRRAIVRGRSRRSGPNRAPCRRLRATRRRRVPEPAHRRTRGIAGRDGGHARRTAARSLRSLRAGSHCRLPHSLSAVR